MKTIKILNVDIDIPVFIRLIFCWSHLLNSPFKRSIASYVWVETASRFLNSHSLDCLYISTVTHDGIQLFRSTGSRDKNSHLDGKPFFQNWTNPVPTTKTNDRATRRLITCNMTDYVLRAHLYPKSAT